MTIVMVKVNTEGDAGSATGTRETNRIKGYLEAVRIVFNESAPATTDVTIVAGDPIPHAIATSTNSATNVTIYPVVQTSNSSTYRQIFIDWQTVTVNVADCDELTDAVTVYLSIKDYGA
jgi:hypothetical protein